MGRDYLEGWQSDRTMEDEVQDLLSTTITVVDTPSDSPTINIVTMDKLHTTVPQEILCPRCGSNQTMKHGTQGKNHTQFYICNKCHRRFNTKGAPIGMQTPADQMGAALGMYYNGMSLSGCSRQLNESFGTKVDPSTVYRWLMRYTQKAVDELGSHSPQVSDVWVADETVINVRGSQTKSTDPNSIWFWDIIDEGTRFLLGSHMSATRRISDVRKVMHDAQVRADKSPNVILTDKLRSYIDGIELVFDADTRHIQSKGFTSEVNTNLIERFHGTIKQRTKSVRGFKTPETANLILQGFLVNYNFFRPHMTLEGKTPADVAGIQYDIRSWTELVKA